MTPRMPELLARKRDGGRLTNDELRWIIDGVVQETIPLAQLGAWLMACQCRGLDTEETAALTRAMIDSGQRLTWADGPVVDKHSTGGVGDGISLALAPALIACGVQVPMLAGRGLAHTGGTIDKLESIPGYDVQPSLAKLHRLRSFIASQTPELAPADRVLYALRDVTGTVPCNGLITASILSKKVAAGLDALVFDVKCGRAAFMRTRDEARTLARSLVETARALDLDAVAHITAMDQPLGRFIGNALEVRGMLEVLQGEGAPDVRTLVVTLGGTLLRRVDRGDEATLERSLDDGRALDAWRALVRAQGGDPAAALPVAPQTTTLAASPSVAGRIVHDLDALTLGDVACALGAGRATPNAPLDLAVGLELHVAVGDTVPDSGWVTIHHRGPLDPAVGRRLAQALTLGDSPAETPPLLLETVEPR